MRNYYLEPLLEQGQKSFYGKAKVFEHADGSAVLVSYGTKIMRRNPDGTYTRLWDSYSTTTGKHIKAFSGMNKKEFEELPLGQI